MKKEYQNPQVEILMLESIMGTVSVPMSDDPTHSFKGAKGFKDFDLEDDEEEYSNY